MADLKAEQIIAAVVTALQATTTAGANAIRGQIYNSYADQLPGIAIYMGTDEPIEGITQAFFDWQLTLDIQIRVAANTSLEQTIATIRKEIHIAMMSAPTYGLAFVMDTIPGPASAPDLEGEGETPIGIQNLTYQISYRAQHTDLSA